MARRFRNGELSVWKADYDCRTKQGEIRWLYDSSVPLRNAEGKVVGCLGILQDITNRKQWEEALTASERRFRDLLETVQLIAVILDTEGRITFANNYLLALTGYTQEALLGQDWFALVIPPAEREAVRRSFREKLPNGRIATRDENNILTAAGETRLISWNNTTLHNGEGEPIGTASIGVDITERVRMETQLLQAQKMESIGRLTGGVAHDFNNLLTVIQGSLELAQMELEADAEIASYLENIQSAVNRATDLTAQLLAFARKQIIAPRVINVNELILDTSKILRRLIGEHIELITIPKQGLAPTRVDPGQFQQILMNLAVNARDAMPAGGKLVIETDNVSFTSDEAHARGYTEPGDYVMIAISDTGIGMSEETQGHIFEPFFTTKGKGRGTGLGLATCYGIVKQNGGYIWIYSEPEAGTTFKIFLPRVNEPTADLPEPVAEKKPHGTETILLVEDELLVRTIAAKTLRALGYEILEASNGLDALMLAASIGGQIDLLVTDVIMPQMGGGELARRLQASRPELRVLFMSGYTENAAVQQGILNREMAFLQKPFNAAALATKVREVLDRK